MDSRIGGRCGKGIGEVSPKEWLPAGGSAR